MRTSQPGLDGIHRAHYEAAAFDVNRWANRARDLYESACLLEPAIAQLWESYRNASRNGETQVRANHFSGPYFMLMSFAVENLLKAAAIARNREKYMQQFRSSGVFPRELSTHNLARLATLVGLEIVREEEDLFHRLTRNATWFGRYPVPVKYADISALQRFSDGSEIEVNWFRGADVMRLRQFVNSLPSRIGLNEGNWTSAG